MDRRWWAFGFPNGQFRGNAASGPVGEALASGWVRLDSASRYELEPGFSGAGVWSPEYEAVVGLVGQANTRPDGHRDGQAITVYRAADHLLGEDLAALTDWTVAAAGESALAAWGWSLTTDKEAVRHWKPRARGVATDSEQGYRFRGRFRALTEIVTWLGQRRADRRVLVVTGSPGVGKSAVLGRIVTTADAEITASLPPDDDAVRAPVGSIACAVHAKGKTALDVGWEIARAASAPVPDRLEDLVVELRGALAERRQAPDRLFTVVIDALDEATDPAEARKIITQLAVPISETCTDVGARVVVGTRRTDDAGDLLPRFGAALRLIDLDAEDYFALADLAEYTRATLQLRGDERPDNPYADDAAARPVAARIAQLADGNFLVAGLVARSHALHDDLPADPTAIRFPPTVADTLDAYIQRIPAIEDATAAQALTALAYAEAPGFTAELWALAIQALTGRAPAREQLARFVRGSAANFVVQSTHGRGSETAYRLFHQALSDALLASRRTLHPAEADERALTRALLSAGQQIGWNRAHPYLLQSLPGHAQRAGLIDSLLADADYLLYADLRRLTPTVDQAATAAGRQRARLLRLTPRAVNANPDERIALFSVTEALDSLGRAYRDHPGAAPYRARWAATRPHTEQTVLEGHTGEVRAVCPIRLGDRDLLASASNDGTVRIWDPATGQHQRTLTGHTGGVTAVCPIRLGNRDLLASAGYDGTVRIWDPATDAAPSIIPVHHHAAALTWLTNETLIVGLSAGLLALSLDEHHHGAPTTGNPP